MKIYEIKKEARSKLVDKYPQTLISCFLYLAIIIGIDVVLTSILSLITFNTIVGITVTIIILAITFPLSYGLASLFIDHSRGKSVKATDFINRALLNFSNVCKTTTRLLLKFLKYLILGVIIAFLFCFIVVLIEENAFTATQSQKEIIGNATILFVTIAYTLGIIACYLPYSLSYYVLKDNSKTAGKESLIKSKSLLKDHIGEYILLYFSFVPYGCAITIIQILLDSYTEIPEIGTVVGLVGSILLMPYVLMSVSVFYNKISDYKEEKPIAKKEKVKEIADIKKEEKKEVIAEKANTEKKTTVKRKSNVKRKTNTKTKSNNKKTS